MSVTQGRREVAPGKLQLGQHRASFAVLLAKADAGELFFVQNGKTCVHFTSHCMEDEATEGYSS